MEIWHGPMAGGYALSMEFASNLPTESGSHPERSGKHLSLSHILSEGRGRGKISQMERFSGRSDSMSGLDIGSFEA